MTCSLSRLRGPATTGRRRHSTTAEESAQPVRQEDASFQTLRHVRAHHDSEVRYLRCQVAGNAERERFRGLGQEGAIHVTVRYPYDLAVLVIESSQHLRDVHDLPALVLELAR